ncbi:MAG: VCBS repeat-containing protein [Bacteroidetes bacterium]|nr:VCBS repeat-containing protein [Bacteroidota bacterium]
MAVADYDNDHDIDILLTGHDRYGNSNSIIYRNDNNWKFTELSLIFTKTDQVKPQFIDFNNDGKLDLLGRSSTGMTGIDIY